MAIPLYIFNDEPVTGFSLGFKHKHHGEQLPTSVELTSWSAAGSVIPQAARDYCQTKAKPDSNQFLIGWIDLDGDKPIPPGRGLLGTLWLRILPGASLDTINLDTTFVPPAGLWELVIDTSIAPGYQTTGIDPEYVDCGVADIRLEALCGDVDVTRQVDLSDIVYLIKYIFSDGPPPQPYPLNGDVDCNGHVSLSDAVYLVNYIFLDGAPRPCVNCR